jgi:hypothetical protein
MAAIVARSRSIGIIDTRKCERGAIVLEMHATFGRIPATAGRLQLPDHTAGMLESGVRGWDNFLCRTSSQLAFLNGGFQ